MEIGNLLEWEWGFTRLGMENGNGEFTRLGMENGNGEFTRMGMGNLLEYYIVMGMTVSFMATLLFSKAMYD